MLRYTLLRLLMFFGTVCVGYLVGLRHIPLLIISAVVSSILSLVILQGPRERFAQQVEQKVTERREKAEESQRTAEDEEDEEVDRASRTREE